jgi:hypothetical protein
MLAYCYRSGQIYFRRDSLGLPKGAISLGLHRRIRAAVTPIARMAYDNKTMLVPGVPEAVDDHAAFEALCRFEKEVKKRIDRIDRRHLSTPA